MGVRCTAAVAIALALGASGAAEAQDPVHDTAVLTGRAFSNAQGAIAVNAAAGANNQQANVAVIAQGDESVGSAVLIQFLESTDGAGDRQMSAMIADRAFANSSGLIAVNVAAGADNQQGNLALVSIEPGTGRIKTMIGDRNEHSQFGLATQGRRQPGSSFKVFALICVLVVSALALAALAVTVSSWF